jgi:hypothetical protein
MRFGTRITTTARHDERVDGVWDPWHGIGRILAYKQADIGVNVVWRDRYSGIELTCITSE